MNDGGPAFPSSNSPDTGYYAEGMTLRDYFAARAMSIIGEQLIRNQQLVNSEIFAEACYELADAMLKERAK
jgi:hypothetical protein